MYGCGAAVAVYIVAVLVPIHLVSSETVNVFVNEGRGESNLTHVCVESAPTGEG